MSARACRLSGIILATLGGIFAGLSALVRHYWGTDMFDIFLPLFLVAIGSKAAIDIIFSDKSKTSIMFLFFSCLLGGVAWGSAIGGTLSGLWLTPFLIGGGDAKWMSIPAMWGFIASLAVGASIGFGLGLGKIVSRIRKAGPSGKSNAQSRGILALCLLCLLPEIVHATPIPMEKGDLVFRELAAWQDVPFAEYAGHTGIYWKYTGGDPDDMLNHRIIEALDLTGVWVTTLKGFHDSAPFLGPWTKNPTYIQRAEIVDFANQQFGKPYAFFAGYKGPDTFRCDGLAEFAYETFGIDIVPNDNAWFEIWPKLQLSHMSYATGTGPQIQVRNADGQPVPDGGATSDIGSIYATDGDHGSGIFLLELWQGDPVSGGTLKKSFPQTYALEKTYTSSDIGTLPEGQIFVRAYDQAGNYTQVSFIIGTPKVSILEFAQPISDLPTTDSPSRRFDFSASNTADTAPWLRTPSFVLPAGTESFDIYANVNGVTKIVGPVFDTPTTSISTVTVSGLPAGVGHYAVLRDTSGVETTILFNHDVAPPGISVTGVTIGGCVLTGSGESWSGACPNFSSWPSEYRVDGTATDELSGVERAVLAPGNDIAPYVGPPTDLQKPITENVRSFGTCGEPCLYSLYQAVVAVDRGGYKQFGLMTRNCG